MPFKYYTTRSRPLQGGGDDYCGFSVTIPHKEDALKCCAEVDPVVG